MQPDVLHRALVALEQRAGFSIRLGLASCATMQPASSIVDFSDFGYLGLRHRMDELQAWDRFGSGRPAVADDAVVGDALGQRVAALQGCQAATLATSTLHAFSDVCVALADEEVMIFLDEYVYPIVRWGVERAACRGTPVVTFQHHSLEHLQSLISDNDSQSKRPIVITDGVSPLNWAIAPLPKYLDCIESRGGLLLVDDTQQVGVLGHSPAPGAPYGLGGGGSLCWHEIESPHVLLIASLTKGLGVPIATVSGSDELINWFLATSQSRIHCSPPSAATLSALEHALDVNEAHGDELRQRLAANVIHLRNALRYAGLDTDVGHFPVQVVLLPSGIGPVALEAALRTRCVRAILQRDTGGVSKLLLVVTAEHDHEELEFAVNAIRDSLDELAALATPVDVPVDFEPCQDWSSGARTSNPTELGPASGSNSGNRASYHRLRR